jgi:DNA repair protein RecN (Recombination protein N)
MLKNLFVKDYALIKEINVGFEKGLNIITGETGAGKSILIDAMGLLLGERASSEVVRKEANKAIVEGIFEPETDDKINLFLRENDLENLPELILRREVMVKGTNRCFINDTPVSLNQLREIGNLLVDLHGQHEHQSLLRTETHIDYLDEFASTGKLVEEYKTLYAELNKQISYLNELLSGEAALKEKKEIYSFQLNEIDSVSPEADEDEKISDELRILENSEKLFELTSSVYDKLYESDESILDQVNQVKHDLFELQKIDKSFSDIFLECDNSLTLLKDISEFLRGYKSKINVDPDYLENLRTRISSINLLKKKYGGSLKNVLEFREKISGEISLAENFSERISEIENKIDTLRNQCGVSAGKISRKGKKFQKLLRSR